MTDPASTIRNLRQNIESAADFRNNFSMDMMIISFTPTGFKLAMKLKELLPDMETEIYVKCKSLSGEKYHWAGSIEDFASKAFLENSALLFIGACGIAVRAIAGCVRDKLKDIPVLVMDEAHDHIIPLLSGHMGGGNELAIKISNVINSDPVITTATDLYGEFSGDIFAKENGLDIYNREGIAAVNSRVLRGEGLVAELHCEEDQAEDIFLDNGGKASCESYSVRQAAGKAESPYLEDKGDLHPDIIISGKYWDPEAVKAVMGDDGKRTVLILRPKDYVLGIGCKRGTGLNKIEAFVISFLEEHNTCLKRIYKISSVSLKAEEEGIREFARKNRIPYVTYSPEELEALEGDFTDSDFVRNITGTGNVCERAAMLCCGAGGELIVRKTSGEGITLALAKRKVRIEL